MLPPLPRCSSQASSSLISPGRISLPRKRRRVGLHIVLFEACSAFTHVAACTLARSPIRDPLSEGFSHFVTSMTAPVASGWSVWPGGTLTHWKAPPCHGAPSSRTSCEVMSDRCRWRADLSVTGCDRCAAFDGTSVCGLGDLIQSQHTRCHTETGDRQLGQ